MIIALLIFVLVVLYVMSELDDYDQNGPDPW